MVWREAATLWARENSVAAQMALRAQENFVAAQAALREREDCCGEMRESGPDGSAG